MSLSTTQHNLHHLAATGTMAAMVGGDGARAALQVVVASTLADVGFQVRRTQRVGAREADCGWAHDTLGGTGCSAAGWPCERLAAARTEAQVLAHTHTQGVHWTSRARGPGPCTCNALAASNDAPPASSSQLLLRARSPSLSLVSLPIPFLRQCE